MNGALIILGIAVLLLGAAVAWLIQKKPSSSEDVAVHMLKQDIQQITQGLQNLNDGLKDHLTERLDKNNEQIAKQYEASAKIIRDVTQKLVALERTNQQVGDVAAELKTLQNVLQNPKQRGVLGEYYLEQILQNLLPPSSYKLQHKLAEGLVVDAAIFIDDRFKTLATHFFRALN